MSLYGKDYLYLKRRKINWSTTKDESTIRSDTTDEILEKGVRGNTRNTLTMYTLRSRFILLQLLRRPILLSANYRVKKELDRPSIRPDSAYSLWLLWGRWEGLASDIFWPLLDVLLWGEVEVLEPSGEPAPMIHHWLPKVVSVPLFFFASLFFAFIVSSVFG